MAGERSDPESPPESAPSSFPSSPEANPSDGARTAPQIRSSPLSQREKARRYNVSRATIQKWEKREDVRDRSHRPHEMATRLSPAQETIVLEIRHLTRLPMEDWLVLIQKIMKPDMSYPGAD
jgi:hypothetical protein